MLDGPGQAIHLAQGLAHPAQGRFELLACLGTEAIHGGHGAAQGCEGAGKVAAGQEPRLLQGPIHLQLAGHQAGYQCAAIQRWLVGEGQNALGRRHHPRAQGPGGDADVVVPHQALLPLKSPATRADQTPVPLLHRQLHQHGGVGLQAQLLDPTDRHPRDTHLHARPQTIGVERAQLHRKGGLTPVLLAGQGQQRTHRQQHTSQQEQPRP